MARDWGAERRTRDAEERKRRRRRARRRVRRLLDPETYLKLGRRQARRYLRSLSRPARRRLERELRRRKYRARRKAFGGCPACGRAGGPGHRCSLRFGEHNAARLRARMDKRTGPQDANLRRGRRAA